MDSRTLDKVSIYIYPMKMHIVFRCILTALMKFRLFPTVPSCHQVVGDFTTLLRSPGDFTKIQCLGLFPVLSHWPTLTCGFLEGWVHAGSSFTVLHDNRFCHLRNQSSNSPKVSAESRLRRMLLHFFRIDNQSIRYYHPSFKTPIHNVDRRNPTAVDMEHISFIIGFHR